MGNRAKAISLLTFLGLWVIFWIYVKSIADKPKANPTPLGSSIKDSIKNNPWPNPTPLEDSLLRNNPYEDRVINYE